MLCPRLAALPGNPADTGKNWPLLARAIDRELNCPRASSCGRLFDAAAAALDICHEQISFEGEAACRLEAQAWQAWPQETPVTLKIDEQGELAMGDFWRDWLSWQTSVPLRALAFHRAIADGLAALLRYHAEREGCQTLVLSGGTAQSTAASAVAGTAGGLPSAAARAPARRRRRAGARAGHHRRSLPKRCDRSRAGVMQRRGIGELMTVIKVQPSAFPEDKPGTTKEESPCMNYPFAKAHLTSLSARRATAAPSASRRSGWTWRPLLH